MFHKLLLKLEAQISTVQKNMANHISLQLITASLKLYPLGPKEIIVGEAVLAQSCSCISHSLDASSPDENNIDSFLLTSVLP